MLDTPTLGTIEIARAVSADAEALSAVAALTFPLACPDALTREDIAAFVERNLSPSVFRRYLDESTSIALLARDGRGDPLGYVLALPGDAMDPDSAPLVEGARPLGISKFYAAPRAHGSGLSTAMLRATIEIALGEGFDALWLSTNLDNTRARRFYEREGFLVRGGRFFTVGSSVCEDAVYEKPLVGPPA